MWIVALKVKSLRTFLMVPWLRCHTSNIEGTAQSLVRELRSHMVCSQKKKKKNFESHWSKPRIEPEASAQAGAVFD